MYFLNDRVVRILLICSDCLERIVSILHGVAGDLGYRMDGKLVDKGVYESLLYREDYRIESDEIGSYDYVVIFDQGVNIDLSGDCYLLISHYKYPLKCRKQYIVESNNPYHVLGVFLALLGIPLEYVLDRVESSVWREIVNGYTHTLYSIVDYGVKRLT